MAATSGNTHIEDGKVYTQAECDAYQVLIDDVQSSWDWMTGVTRDYTLRTGTYNSTTKDYENFQAGVTINVAGAHEWYPEWRNANPDITEVSATEGSQAWGQWDYFTNRRSDWDAEAAQMKIDLDIMKATKVEMLATVD